MAAASHATATVVVAEGRPLPRTFPAQAQPRVYLHRFMDGAHRELLRAPAVARFFDLWHPLNASNPYPCPYSYSDPYPYP